MALISVLKRVVVLNTMGVILSEVKGQHDVTNLLGPTLRLVGGHFGLNDGGKPNVEITLEIIELSFGIRT